MQISRLCVRECVVDCVVDGNAAVVQGAPIRQYFVVARAKQVHAAIYHAFHAGVQIVHRVRVLVVKTSD